MADMVVEYSVADYLEYLGGQRPLPEGSSISIRDFDDAIGSLSDDQLSALKDNNVVSIDAKDNTLSLSISQIVALDGAVNLSADDKLTVLDTEENLSTMSSEMIKAFDEMGFDFVESTGAGVRISEGTYFELLAANIGFVADDNVVVESYNKLGLGFSLQELAELSARGVDVIDRFGSGSNMPKFDTTFGFAHAKVLADSNITFAYDDPSTADIDEDDSVIIYDEGADISKLSAEQLSRLSGKGVDEINAWDDALVLSFGQYNALHSIKLDPTDVVTLNLSLSDLADLDDAELADLATNGVDILHLVDSGEALSSLSVQQIDDLRVKGIKVLDASNDAIVFSLAQYNALGAMNLTASDAVTLTLNAAEVKALTGGHAADAKAKGVDILSLKDTGQALSLLTAAEIAALSSKSIDALDATDNKLVLSVDQYNALGSTKLTASDAIVVADAGAKLSSLSAAQITALAKAGIDGLDAKDDRLSLSVDQYNALGTIKLTASDTVTVSDNSTKFTALTAAQISSLAAAGIDELDASNDSYTLSSAQYDALGSIKLSANDRVTIVTDGDATLSNGGTDVTLTGNAIRGTGNSLANIVSGNAKNNALAGLEGDDFLYGGSGKDQLSGGLGKDVFVFDTKLSKSTNVDTIVDFKSKDDSIYLDNKVFTKLGKGAPTKPVKFKSDMFVEGAKAKDKEDRIVYDKKTGSLYYDADGTGKAAQVKIATMANKEKLFFHDFFVI